MGDYSPGVSRCRIYIGLFGITEMNTRIQEFIKQATIRVNNPIVNTDGKVVCDDWEEGVSLSKFAQLIAEDCAKMLDEDSCWNPELGGYAHDIRTRYGVK
jgi:hypothetical protein